jgi:hypothetical protein
MRGKAERSQSAPKHRDSRFRAYSLPTLQMTKCIRDLILKGTGPVLWADSSPLVGEQLAGRHWILLIPYHSIVRKVSY